MRLDPTRLRLLPRGRYLLVVDRRSGRWLSLAAEEEPWLRLLVADGLAPVPAEVRARVDRLRRLLVDAKVGVDEPGPAFDRLNTLILKLTNACNLACSYCYDYEKVEHARVIDAETAERAIAQALELCPERLWVILHGGEPMLVWDLVERIVLRGEAEARAQGKAISFSGQTNMTRLDGRIAGFSLDHDILWGLSIDGPAPVNDALRVGHGGGGSHALFAECLRRFPRFVRSCGVLSTITALNQESLLATARHFRDLGMASWDWSLFQPIGRGRELAGRLQLDARALGRGWDALFAAVEGGEFSGFPVKPVTKYLDNFLRGPGHNMCMRARCGAGRDLLSVSADGTIEACDCIDPVGPLGGLGHLAGGSLASARAAPLAERIRSRDMDRNDPCDDCIWFALCGGTCLAHAGDIDALWPEACAMAQLAFDRISLSLAGSDALIDYAGSLR